MAGLPAYQSVLMSGKQTSADLAAALVTRTKAQRFTKCNFQHGQNYEYDPSAANIGPDLAAQGPYDLKLDAELLGFTEGVIEQAYLSCMGAVSTATEGAGTPQAHRSTFTFANSVPAAGGYVSVERGFGTSTEAEAANFAITRVEARGGSAMVRYMLKGVGGKPQRVTKSTPTYTTAPPLPGSYLTTITIGGASTKCRGWSHYVDHHNEENGYDGTHRYRTQAEYQEAEAGCDVELLFENMDMLRRFWSSATATEPDATGTAPAYATEIKTEGKQIPTSGGTEKHTLDWKATSCVLDSLDVELAGRDLIRQRIRGRALRDGTDGVAKVYMINTSASV